MWGLRSTPDIDKVLQQPFKVAVVSVFSNQVVLTKFDLVVIMAFEPYDNKQISQWIAELGIKNFVVISDTKPLLDQSVYWSNLLNLHFMHNKKYQDYNNHSRPFLFDALLGTKKHHRDYVFSRLSQDQLLDQGIVTYRDVFKKVIKSSLPAIDVPYPYVSPGLDPDWEIPFKTEWALSRLVPWHIYQQTWYSIVCETIEHGYWFFFTEKIMKPMYAKRLFVVFGTQYYLENLKSLGFQTFDTVMDESYDGIVDQQQRHQAAYNAFRELLKQNPRLVMNQIQSVVDHNHNRLIELHQELDHNVIECLKQHTPADSWL